MPNHPPNLGVVREGLTNGRVGVSVTGGVSASAAKRWMQGVRVRPENCEEDIDRDVLFCLGDAMTNPCGDFSFNVTECAASDEGAVSDSDDF